MELKYQNGRVLDPRDGTTYRAMMMLSPDGQTLAVRGTDGYFFVPHRGQIWNRLPEHAPTTPAGK